MLRTLLVIVHICLLLPAISQEEKTFESSEFEYFITLLKPTGEFIDGYPVMVLFPDTSPAYTAVNKIIENTFVKDVLEIYSINQNYLKNLGVINQIAPACLALTNNQGGYAKKGFYLRKDEETLIDNTSRYYVDIILNRLLTNYYGLMSFTQLFPHELAHVIYGLTSLNDSVDPENRNVDMHYFPVITDYSTAFNEGFAEHFENISRLFEKNPQVLEGINSDITSIERLSEICIKGFIHDFQYPFRLGYYKSSIIYWYQKYEDYRRYIHALDASVRHINIAPDVGSIEDQLTIRNTGVLYDSKTRNLVQLCATEGVICSFFTRIIQSNLPNKYYNESFYRPFLPDTTLVDFVPEEKFSPLQNQFTKYFHVIHHYVSKYNSSTVQLLDFVNAYMNCFPEEADKLKDIFLETTGREIPDTMPPQLWLMVKDHEHRILAIDPFGAVTIPVYTFDLNAAELIDLLTIKGLSKKDATAIIQHRDDNGLFYSFEELAELEGISEDGLNLLFNSRFDKEYFNSISEPELSFSAIINTPIKVLAYRIALYLVAFMVFLNVFMITGRKIKIKKRIWLSIRYCFLWILLSLIGMALALFVASPLIWIITISGILILTSILINRKKPGLVRSLSMITMMCLAVILSLI